MDEKMKSPIKSALAAEKPRDEAGHFVHQEPQSPESTSSPKSPQNPVSQFFKENTHYSKGKDDLVDIHVGNPLSRITKLLEDIKKQKAFSFTLKGSLGVMGVFLTLSIFGVFGGGHLLCDKGVHSEIGTVRTLNVLDTDTTVIPVVSLFLDYFNPKAPHNRTVLIRADESVIQIPYAKGVDLSNLTGESVIMTGNFDACAQILSVRDMNGVEKYID